jgi:hypothetical protein
VLSSCNIHVQKYYCKTGIEFNGNDLFDDDTTISALQCGHTFHEECIKKWLKTSNTCPSCRDAVEHGKIIKKLF